MTLKTTNYLLSLRNVNIIKIKAKYAENFSEQWLNSYTPLGEGGIVLNRVNVLRMVLDLFLFNSLQTVTTNDLTRGECYLLLTGNGPTSFFKIHLNKYLFTPISDLGVILCG